jgi:energy-coupling factor transporter transmembrane protein EcfT
VSEATPTTKLRVRSGLGFVQVLRPALYALLVLSAFLTFWSGGEIAGMTLPRWARSAAPVLFGIFLVVFSVYRLALMRAKKYPAATGFFQIGLGALIWVMLLPGTRQAIVPPEPTDEVRALMSAPDPRVRALAAEVAGTRPDGTRYAAQLIERLADPDVRVQRAARAALVRLAGGVDLGAGREGPAAVEAWRQAAQERGWLNAPP